MMMRMLLGIILGVFLTIGGTYIYDASSGALATRDADNTLGVRPMVNWDVVSQNWRSLEGNVRKGFDHLAER
jgi:hypothetical protein